MVSRRWRRARRAAGGGRRDGRGEAGEREAKRPPCHVTTITPCYHTTPDIVHTSPRQESIQVLSSSHQHVFCVAAFTILYNYLPSVHFLVASSLFDCRPSAYHTSIASPPSLAAFLHQFARAQHWACRLLRFLLPEMVYCKALLPRQVVPRKEVAHAVVAVVGEGRQEVAVRP